MISYGKDEKLLSVPKLGSGTGYSMANAVNEALTENDLDKNVVAMAFDTTASNTGRHAGACKSLEDMLGRKVIWLPCRHHIMELIIGSVYGKCMGVCAGGEENLFKRLKHNWEIRPNIKL